MMRVILMALAVVGVLATAVQADWLVDFDKSYKDKGIDVAVERAMKDGVDAEKIFMKGLGYSELNPQNLIKALYCAGAESKEITRIAEANDISKIIIADGFDKSIAECGERLADSQAFQQRRRGSRFGGPPPDVPPVRPRSRDRFN